jgi:hydrogenase nickel incorporation protein HypA/HybF
MHELSIAMEIVEIAREEALKAGALKINKIELEIGKLSGVLPDALSFAMHEAIKASPLANAEIVYHYKEAQVNCSSCCETFETNDHLKVCPVCGSFDTYFVTGKELFIKSMDIEIV